MTLEELEAQRAAIPDDGALLASTTRDELAAIQQRRATLDRRILHAREATTTLVALGGSDPDQKWLDFETSARKNLCDELLTNKSAARDAHLIRLQSNITRSIN